MTVINTNISALTAQNAKRSANNMIGLAIQRLSTDQRINSAKDDAAGLAIGQKVTADVRGLAVAIDAPPQSSSGLNEISPAVYQSCRRNWP